MIFIDYILIDFILIDYLFIEYTLIDHIPVDHILIYKYTKLSLQVYGFDFDSINNMKVLQTESTYKTIETTAFIRD